MKPIKFAAKKVGWSQSDKGFVLRLLVAPDDDWEGAAMAPLGAPFGVVMVAVDQETGLASPSELPSQQRGGAGKPRQPWSEMLRVKQAGILCSRPDFQDWLNRRHGTPKDEDAAVAFVHNHCAVHSRREIDSNDMASRRWDALVDSYRADTGQVAEQRA